jgi:hypothetical protein
VAILLILVAIAVSLGSLYQSRASVRITKTTPRAMLVLNSIQFRGYNISKIVLRSGNLWVTGGSGLRLSEEAVEFAAG